MYPLFETLCVQNGEIRHKAYHLRRFRSSYFSYFGCEPPYDLLDGIRLPGHETGEGHAPVKKPSEPNQRLKAAQGLYRLRIDYGRTGRRLSLSPYQKKSIRSLQLLVNDEITYKLKYSDRRALDRMFALRAACDDVLIVKNGSITDTSFCNIAFFDGSHWLTPSEPLLCGTTRQRLLEEGLLVEARIRPKDLRLFSSWKLFNALRPFEEAEALPVEQIVGT